MPGISHSRSSASILALSKWALNTIGFAGLALSALLTMGAEGLAQTTTATAPRSGERSNVWAIIVGVNNYQDERIPDCRSSIEDARSIESWFRVEAGWPARHVATLIDSGESEPRSAQEDNQRLRPTRANLNWVFRDWLGTRARPGDLVVLYFAGQAIRVAGSEASGDRELLLPIDANPDALLSSAWSLDETLDELLRRDLGQVCCWLDTSLAGRRSERVIVAGGNPNPNPTGTETQLAGQPGRNLLYKLARGTSVPVTAWLAADGQPLVEPRGSSRGAFSRALLEGLGTSDNPRSLAECLYALQHDPELQGQGFRFAGDVELDKTLWPKLQGEKRENVPELRLSRGHADRVSNLAFSLDGGLLVSAALDSSIRIWRIADRLALKWPSYHEIGVSCLSLSSDQRLIASGDHRGQVRVWDLLNQRALGFTRPRFHLQPVAQVAFTRTNRQLVTRDASGEALLWEVVEAQLRSPKPLVQGRCQAVATNTSLRRSTARYAPIAAALVDGSIVLLNVAGEIQQRIPSDQPREITNLTYAPSGDWFASGDRSGKVLLHDAETGDLRYTIVLSSPIREIRFARGGVAPVIVVATENSLLVARIENEKPVETPLLDRPIGSISLSNDGRMLAALELEHPFAAKAWNLAQPSRPEPIVLAGDATGCLSVAVSPGGESLAAGASDGGVRLFSLPGGRESATFPANRVMVKRLAGAPDGSSLAQITQDGHALIWRLRDPRGVEALGGVWSTATFFPDNRTIALTGRPDAGGDVVVTAIDRPTPGEILKRPEESADAVFVEVAVSPDGRWIAALGDPGDSPLLCLWEAKTRKLIRSMVDEQRTFTALAFAREENALFTGTESGSIQRWDLSTIDKADGSFRLAAELPAPNVEASRTAVTALSVAPSKTPLLAIGTRSGSIRLVRQEQASLVQAQELSSASTLAVRDLAFSPDGRFLIAPREAGNLTVWRSGEGVGEPWRGIPLGDLPHHDEQVTALIGWPTGPLVASGSIDTTIRIWNLELGKKIATLCAFEQGGQAAKQDLNAKRPIYGYEWVAFTPAGFFEGSVKGEERLYYLVGRDTRPVQVFEPFFRIPDLAKRISEGTPLDVDLLRAAEKRPDMKRMPPRGLSLQLPRSEPVLGRDLAVTIRVEEPGLSDLRLYHNGAPMPIVPASRREEDPVKFALDVVPAGRLAQPVKLRKGLNRFHAMASRPGFPDRRSNEVQIECLSEEESWRVHTISLGISKYQKRALRYADIDATSISRYLGREVQASKVEAGTHLLLTNDDVTESALDKAFVTVSEAVAGRPQDVVILFLAGHTDVVDSQFSLLLPRFPFPEQSPLQVAVRGRPEGERPVNEPPTRTDQSPLRQFLIPYSWIYRRLLRLEALQRLVIVDACQAEAIYEDPNIEKIHQALNLDSHRARVSYLLATRRGEAATESDILEHGLLTYTLLRGLQAPGLKSLPSGLEVAGFRDPGKADWNNDGIITTSELARFVEFSLPELSRQFPSLISNATNVASRGDNPTQAQRGPGDPANPAARDLSSLEAREQRLRIRSVEGGFPLFGGAGTNSGVR